MDNGWWGEQEEGKYVENNKTFLGPYQLLGALTFVRLLFLVFLGNLVFLRF